ncbi:MAG: hypothetical protein EHM89_13960 [Acidobacteria bacterium]|nr:MAG: hypothetical protein EHM89_13960 [Acidobacteriota bacterium]
MSRAGAAFGSLIGGSVGFAAGYFAASPIAHATDDPRFPWDRQERLNMEMNFALVGAVIGSFAGAAVGAGSCTVKQIGTAGVGELPRLSHPRFP